MKKTLAALGASVLGLGVVAVPATTAAAAPPIEPCENVLDQLESVGDFNEVWLGDCVPQYGLGKAEFTIVADEDNPTAQLPEGFTDLNDAFISEDSPVVASTTLDTAAIEAYFFDTEAQGVMPITAIALDDETPESQTYIAFTVVPVASTGMATEENTPADVVSACEVSWPGPEEDLSDSIGWFATFHPVDTTYTQTVGGTEWIYEITAQSNPSYFFFTYDEVESEEYVCVTDGESTIREPLDSITGIEELLLFLGAMPFISPGVCFCEIPTSLEQAIAEVKLGEDSSFAAIGESGLYDLGIFGPTAPKPQLASTGADAGSLLVPALIAGGVVIVGGTLITLAVVRRRRSKA